MSNYTNVNTHTAGGLEGLALGAPIGGASATTGAGSGLISSSNTAGGIGSGLTGSSHQPGSGLTGSSSTGTGIGSGLTGSSHQHGSGLTGSSTTGTGSSAYDQGAANSTSGERGIGGGRGGPTAFESDATRVGTTGGAGDHGHVGHEHGQHGHSHGTGITGPTGTGAGDDKAAIKALTGAGHHDQSRVGQYDSGATTGAGSHGSHGHGLAATAAAGGAGLGAAGLASHGHRGGEVDDSVTGQEHFRSQVGEKTAGDVGRASTLTGAGAGAGLGHGSSATSQGAPVASGGAGYGAGSLAAAGAGAGAAAVGAGSHGHGHSHGNNPVSELKQELKDHQSGPGYDKAEHHTETEGPHGLVWHNGKYVHKREIEGKGSTGVPLK